jgi:hypothetical protein
VDTQEGQAIANEIGALFYETSAKDNNRVDELFTSIAVELKKKNK